nr:Chain E, KB752 peptide [Homo sapiens]1Y3A_F Chain F, KB752 peptide [Homo sapiens]1Y3A_G Chain G, KB752 peptide [Homo sapiens]1Y3A_H Chain H, KB752 peptide [Homo sapiens]3QE0_F Chain F, KB752 peptide [synthetic construct]3QE0_G Chain G, KB752 peptide [synthetic construct]6MHE_C Chain C, KB752 peptide [synthetic construct]
SRVTWYDFLMEDTKSR